jgi:transcription antitermination factor NusG
MSWVLPANVRARLLRPSFHISYLLTNHKSTRQTHMMARHLLGNRWYALYVRPRHEKTVCSQLEARQQETYLPLYQTRNKWADRWQTVSLPLFPGYVFCRFDIARRSSILSASGIIDVVRSGFEPAPIETSQIEAIQLILKSPAFIEPHPYLVRGDRVILRDGPFNGLTGSLMEVRNTLRLVVSVELLCRSVLVEIDRDWVAPLPVSLSKSA